VERTQKLNHLLLTTKSLNHNNAGTEIFNIGEDISLNYPTHYLGQTLNDLDNDLLKKHLKKATNPILIVGSGFLINLTLIIL
jgi:hypothetical protein